MGEPAVGMPPFSRLPVVACDWPVLFEDDGQESMGDTRPHTTAEAILRFGLMAHFAAVDPRAEVLANMNLYYHPTNRWAYVSPDIMVVVPPAPLPADLRSYRAGETGPAPVLTVEVLSRRTFQQHDLTLKPDVYANLGVAEYLLADVTGAFLPQRLALKTRDAAGWADQPDEGDGVTSPAFGFRVRLMADGQVRVFDAATGEAYARPEEAQQLARERHADRRRVRELEAELARLRAQLPPG